MVVDWDFENKYVGIVVEGCEDVVVDVKGWFVLVVFFVCFGEGEGEGVDVFDFDYECFGKIVVKGFCFWMVLWVLLLLKVVFFFIVVFFLE